MFHVSKILDSNSKKIVEAFFEIQGMICKNVFVSSKTAAGEKLHEGNMIYRNLTENLKS